MARKGKRGAGAKKKRKPTMAERADRHLLYQKSVQDTGFEYDFVDSTFRKLTGRKAHHLREDFCGTAQMCCEWVSQRRTNHATGVDLDPEVLAWGQANNIARLKPGQQRRVQLLQQDVLRVATDPVDVVVAMNFSWQIFTERALLRRYFARVRRSLVEDGVFFLDIYGGYEAFKEMKERTKHRNFTYIWDQASYNPVNGHMQCYIHFSFPDGSRLRRAFSYYWRLWTLPELQEILREAGFKEVTVYWQGTDEKTGEANGVFEPATEGDADPAWICFVSARNG